MPSFDDLEDFPLAKAYGWKKPKTDTGGIFYLYPPIVSKERKHHSGVDRDFYRMKRKRIESLNPDEVMQDIEFRDYNGEPHPRFAQKHKGSSK